MDKSTVQMDQLMNLVRGVGKAIEDDWKASARALGLTQPQQHLLWILFLLGGKATMSEIAKMGCWHISTVMDITARMERKGLVTRSTDTGDLRITNVTITDKGKELRQRSEVEGARYMRILQLGKDNGDPWINGLITNLRELCVLLHGEQLVKEIIDKRYDRVIESSQ